MNVYTFLAYFIPLIASQSHEEFYHELTREREVTKFILNERLCVVDRSIHNIEKRILEFDCPLYLYASRVRLLHDKNMIEKMIISLRKY